MCTAIFAPHRLLFFDTLQKPLIYCEWALIGVLVSEWAPIRILTSGGLQLEPSVHFAVFIYLRSVFVSNFTFKEATTNSIVLIHTHTHTVLNIRMYVHVVARSGRLTFHAYFGHFNPIPMELACFLYCGEWLYRAVYSNWRRQSYSVLSRCSLGE